MSFFFWHQVQIFEQICPFHQNLKQTRVAHQKQLGIDIKQTQRKYFNVHTLAKIMCACMPKIKTLENISL